MNKETRDMISQSLGQGTTDRYNARFFMHKVPDGSNDTIIKAQELADVKAQRKTDSMGKYQAPDYSPKNLIKLGAIQTHKELLYVEIKRIGAKDFRSMEATEQHKQQFETQYNHFLAENKDVKSNRSKRNIQEVRNVVQINRSGSENSSGSSTFGGGFSYSFDIS